MLLAIINNYKQGEHLLNFVLYCCFISLIGNGHLFQALCLSLMNFVERSKNCCVVFVSDKTSKWGSSSRRYLQLTARLILCKRVIVHRKVPSVILLVKEGYTE